jgi:hypothetical protein
MRKSAMLPSSASAMSRNTSDQSCTDALRSAAGTVYARGGVQWRSSARSPATRQSSRQHAQQGRHRTCPVASRIQPTSQTNALPASEAAAFVVPKSTEAMRVEMSVYVAAKPPAWRPSRPMHAASRATALRSCAALPVASSVAAPALLSAAASTSALSARRASTGGPGERAPKERYSRHTAGPKLPTSCSVLRVLVVLISLRRAEQDGSVRCGCRHGHCFAAHMEPVRECCRWGRALASPACVIPSVNARVRNPPAGVRAGRHCKPRQDGRKARAAHIQPELQRGQNQDPVLTRRPARAWVRSPAYPSATAAGKRSPCC